MTDTMHNPPPCNLYNTGVGRWVPTLGSCHSFLFKKDVFKSNEQINTEIKDGFSISPSNIIKNYM